MRAPAPILTSNRRDMAVLTTAQFSISFALNFMFVFLPFYVQAVSPLDESATLRWTGLIVGAASATATIGSAFWGHLTSRFSPKVILERGLLSHAILVGLMAFTADLRLLLLIRIVQGFLGGISTIGLIIISAISTPDQLARRMGTYHSALTLGQIFSPPLGAMAAATFGYRGAFLASSLMMLAIFLFCQFGLSQIPPHPHAATAEAVPRGQLLSAWLLSFAATIQIVFLPSVLPALLRTFAIPDAAQLLTAGLIVFAYGGAAAAGSYSLARLAGRIPGHRLLLAAALGASLLQVALILGGGPVGFTLIRMAQAFLAAGIFPVILSLVAARSHGRAIGLINTSRFAGNAAGPILATFILARSNLLVLYAVLGAGLAAGAAGHYAAASASPKNR